MKQAAIIIQVNSPLSINNTLYIAREKSVPVSKCVYLGLALMAGLQKKTLSSSDSDSGSMARVQTES